MGKLVVKEALVTPEKAEKLIELCPFGAISYDGKKLDLAGRFGIVCADFCERSGDGSV